jgi:SpoVK/Ycf46/Vps4 family AAA+-type ATPase
MEPFEIKLKGELDFGLYNEGFEEINKEIVRSIKEDDNGLYILHGDAGTGKTTYIRHLIKQLKNNKKFVYVPSNLVNDITSPQFLSFLMGNRNCVFVIEDCENLVVTKNNTRSSAVADMLNMSDGLLADALNIKFICTFNTNEKNIDNALLRPGRCRMKYDFGKLKKERAIEAAKKLGLKEPDKDISLAELFSGENKFVEEKKKIGF